jgi:CRISP-associated protein Cas1
MAGGSAKSGKNSSLVAARLRPSAQCAPNVGGMSRSSSTLRVTTRSRSQSEPTLAGLQPDPWAERSRHWIEASAGPSKNFTPRQRSSPLLLCGHGVSLNVERGTLLIRDGLTHYPQERAEHRLFPGEPTRPTRIVVVDGSGSVSFDVIDWLREQDIAFIRVDWMGNATVIAGGAYAAGGDAWRRQMELRADPKRRMAIARRLIEQKLEASAATLTGCVPETKSRAFAGEVISEKLAVLRSRRALAVSDLHGIEGRAAKVYFDAWVGTPLKWSTSKRRPIPEAWRTIGQRQSMVTGKKGKNRDASHPLNAMLNYAYAILESDVRLQTLANGLDPQRGFLHSGFRDSPAFVLDLMEPLRPIVGQRHLAEQISPCDRMVCVA